MLLLVVACCVSFAAVCCVSFVVSCLVCGVVLLFVIRWLLFVVYCALCAGWCLLFVISKVVVY